MTLRPLDDDAPRTASLQRLLAYSIPTFNSRGQVRWRLQAVIRRQALARLGGREAILNACRRNESDAEDPLERAFLSLLESSGEQIEDRSYGELAHMLEASELLSGIVDGVRGPAVIQKALDHASVLEPLRALVGTHFRGREKELAQLREYVGFLPTDTVADSLRRSARAALGRHDRPPLVVLGVGGIGKSTLLAKFILDHATHTRAIAFTYLDFDRANISIAEPASIMLEAARQLTTQCEDSHRAEWEMLCAQWAAQMVADRRHRHATPMHSPTAPDDRIEPRMVDEFAYALERSFGAGKPFLLVLDTFEEVQYRSRELVGALWMLLDRLGDRLPMLRTVLAGRAPIEGHKTETLELSMLDEKAALGFLEAHGVLERDPQAAQLIVSRLGRSPLTLSLASDILRRDECGLEAISDLTRRQRLFVFSLDHQTAQTELYRRLLRHIHDRDVRKLAHPGLALRRVTPQAIRHVLAGPCELEVDTDERAHELFESLRLEITLVRATEDGALEHRADVRRAMLPMLRENEPDKVNAIHRCAIEYFSHSKSIADRAEEIYHRLAMGDDPTDVDLRWRDGVEDRLRSAVGELPPRAQAYLAARVGVEIDPQAWELASREDIERRTEQRAADHLRVGDPRAALAALTAVTDRAHGSRLYLLEALSYRQLGDAEAALGTINRALAVIPDRGSGITMIEMLELGAQFDSARGDLESAVERVSEAYAVARELNDEPRMLELGTRWLQLRRGLADEDLQPFEVVAAIVQSHLAELSPEVLVARREAAQALAGELRRPFPTRDRAHRRNRRPAADAPGARPAYAQILEP